MQNKKEKIINPIGDEIEPKPYTSKLERDIPQKTKQVQSKNKWLALIFLILALIYDFSPIDIIPDVPIIGWIDDFAITSLAITNYFSESFNIQNEFIKMLLGKVKIIMFILTVILILVTLGVVFLFKAAF